MKHFVYLDTERKVTGTLLSHDIDPDYMKANNIVEVTSDDYQTIDRLLIDHEVYIDDSGYLKAFELLEPALARANDYIDQLATAYIEEGFDFSNFRVRCSQVQQLNILARISSGGKIRVRDISGPFQYVMVTPEQMADIAKEMSNFIADVQQVVWEIKEDLDKAETFEQIRAITDLQTVQAKLAALDSKYRSISQPTQ